MTWHHDLINELIKPVAMVFLVAMSSFGWAMAYQLLKEKTVLQKKLGNKTVEWILNNNNVKEERWYKYKNISEAFTAFINKHYNNTGDIMKWELLTNLQAKLKAYLPTLNQLPLLFRKSTWQKSKLINQSPFLRGAIRKELNLSLLGGSDFTVRKQEVKSVRLICIGLELLGRFRK